METAERPPEVYVDGVSGILIRNGVVKVRFFTTHPNNETPKVEKREDAITIVASVVDILTIHENLNNVVKHLQDTGMIRLATVDAENKDGAP